MALRMSFGLSPDVSRRGDSGGVWTRLSRGDSGHLSSPITRQHLHRTGGWSAARAGAGAARDRRQVRDTRINTALHQIPDNRGQPGEPETGRGRVRGIQATRYTHTGQTGQDRTGRQAGRKAGG